MSRRDQKSRAVGCPEPGFFLMRLVRGGPRVPARIRHVNGMWWAEINGAPFPAASDPGAAPRVFSIWHSGDAIKEAEYRRRLGQSLNAAPDSPLANPGEPINLTKLPPIF